MRLRLRLVLVITVLLAVALGMGGTLLISDSFSSALDAEITDAVHAYELLRGTLELVNAADAQTTVVQTLRELESQGDDAWDSLRLESRDATVYESGSGAFSNELPAAEAGMLTSTVLRVNDKWLLQVDSTLTVNSEWRRLRTLHPLHAFALREKMIVSYLRIYAAVMLVGALLSLLVAVTLTAPLNRLTNAARQIADGDLSKRSGVRGGSEIARLSQDFDRMADRLCENIHTLEQEMERQESFMGAFAHELKTPMTAIIGYADLLRQDALDSADRINAARYIYSEGERLEKLSFKLLDLLMVRHEAFTAAPVRMRTVFAETKQSLAPLLEKSGVSLLLRCADIKVRVEPELTKALLHNLIENAVKATESAAPVLVSCEAVRGGCRIRVEDHGRGMEEAELARITEAFYRVDKARSRAQGGSGLGLTLCREIVALHRGSMRFESARNVGTTVTVVLHELKKEAKK